MTHPTLAALRTRLTLWYCATFAAILGLLGVGLFAAIHEQISEQMRDSLKASTVELIRAEHIREVEAAVARGMVTDAVEELRIPGQRLFLLDAHAGTLTSTIPPDAIVAAGRTALRVGSYEGVHDLDVKGVAEQEGGPRRVFAQRFVAGNGAVMVAIASADEIEIQERYSSLIVSFSLASLVALVLVAAGGWILAGKSTAPIEQNINRMRRFMADAAHELRTPVTVVRSRAEVALQQPRPTEEYVATLHGIGAESVRMAKLVDDLLILARADAGERPVERKGVYLDDVVLNAAEAAQAVAKARNVTVEMAEFEETLVEGDEALLHQLVMILLDNAIKFTPEGGKVTLRIGLIDKVPTLTVSDSGIGIPPDQVTHVFERFYRGDSARTSHVANKERRGAGLGLSIAMWICTEHRAQISLKSVEGEGTTVRVVFPLPLEGLSTSSA